MKKIIILPDSPPAFKPRMEAGAHPAILSKRLGSARSEMLKAAGFSLRSFISIVLFLSLFGCGREEKTSLRVVMGLAEEEWQFMRQEIFPAFEEKHNCIIQAYQVEAVDWPKKLKAMVGANRPEVDVFSQDNMRLYSLVGEDLVEDLTEYGVRVPPSIGQRMRQVGIFQGRVYFFPYRPNVQITYYNQEKFNQYNLKIPADWDELLEVARHFKEEAGIGKVGLKLWGDGPTTTQVYEMIVSAGGNPFEFNDNGCIKTFTFLQKLFPYLSPDSKKAKWDTTTTYLANESFYLAQNWPFATNIIVKDYGKSQIKAYSGWQGPQKRVHVIGGEVLGIPKGAANKDLALEFIFYLESKQVQEKLVVSLGWPSVRDDAYVKVEFWQKPYFQAVEEALAHGVYRPNVLYWGEFDKLLNEAVARILIKQEEVKSVCDEYHEKMAHLIRAYSNE